MNYQEQHKRSIAKAITFRCLVMVSDFVIITAITHRYDVAFGIIIALNIASTALYYFHERSWNKVAWGRQ
ncbi:MAG: DUF2061 domain-containing protein [Candidatus Paceibacterota bacterium]|jgi:uncharacterized membrane protein